MLLTIDVGNTNLEFCIFGENSFKKSVRMATNRDITSDEIGIFLMQFCMINGVKAKDINDVIVASVVPQVMYSLSNAVKKYIEKIPLIVGDNVPYYIENKYNNPSEVGADRLVNAVAAVEKYDCPLIIVDFGTATTFDAVDKDGAYLGGAIYPGIKISMDALFQKASKLPRVELANPDVKIGKNTVQSMQLGAVVGYVGAVENICKHIKSELGEDTKVVATGGLASLIATETDVINTIDKTLTIDGLKLIYDKYKASRV